MTFFVIVRPGEDSLAEVSRLDIGFVQPGAKVELVKTVMTLSIETPALLFSATSLILLAYTNRFLTIAQIVRSLKKHYDENHTRSILLQIKNLNLRLSLIRYMQLFGVLCLFLSVFAMLCLFIDWHTAGIYLFACLS